MWTHGTSLAPAKQKSFLIENPPNPGLLAIKKEEKGGLVKNKHLDYKGHIKGPLFPVSSLWNTLRCLVIILVPLWYRFCYLGRINSDIWFAQYDTPDYPCTWRDI